LKYFLNGNAGHKTSKFASVFGRGFAGFVSGFIQKTHRFFGVHAGVSEPCCLSSAHCTVTSRLINYYVCNASHVLHTTSSVSTKTLLQAQNSIFFLARTQTQTTTQSAPKHISSQKKSIFILRRGHSSLLIPLPQWGGVPPPHLTSRPLRTPSGFATGSTQIQPDTGSGRHVSLIRCITNLNSEN